jgi:DNA-directed RNA polymerase subunit RPC12/RpoP
MSRNSNDTLWQPPPDFQSVPSKIEGVSVFAPLPQRSFIENPATYKCPNCGATTRYNVNVGGIACDHCGHSVSLNSVPVGSEAEDQEFTMETLEHAAQGWGGERKELHCNSCGANVSIEPGILSVTCPFCVSNHVNIRSAPIDILRPLFLIPFKIRPESASHQSVQWLGKGWFHPVALSATAIMHNFVGIYLPFWTFDTKIQAEWKAQVGYERQERYYDHSEKNWKTRTVIDWRWQTGNKTILIDDYLACGSDRMSHAILEQVYPFNMKDLVEYKPDYLAGWQAHTYDIPLVDAWETAQKNLREDAKRACYDDIPSPHIRNFSMIADYKDETWRLILLPVYLSSYRFEDKVYQIMINGQTGAVAGQKPVAWWKVWLAITGLLSPGIILSLIGVMFLLVGGIGVIPLFFGAIFFIIGVIASVSIYKKAVASEAS